jgi:hypothetical protein
MRSELDAAEASVRVGVDQVRHPDLDRPGIRGSERREMMAELKLRSRDMLVFQDGAQYPVFGQVVRVGGDYSWIDVRWFTWAATWSRRFKPNDPVIGLATRRRWTQEELRATAPKLEAVS